MEHFLNHIDWISIKLNILAIILASITGGELVVAFAIVASFTTIVRNVYTFIKKIKNKKQ